MRAGVVRRKEGTDDELARLNGLYRAADLLDDATILVPHRRRFLHRANAAIAPQVRSADACSREADDGVRWFGDLRFGDFFETYVAGSVKNCSAHVYPPCV